MQSLPKLYLGPQNLAEMAASENSGSLVGSSADLVEFGFSEGLFGPVAYKPVLAGR